MKTNRMSGCEVGFQSLEKQGVPASKHWNFWMLALCGAMAGQAQAVTVTPSSGPHAGGNAVWVTNAAPAIGNGSDITNVVLGGVGTTDITGQGTDWVCFVAPTVGSAGVKDLVIQSASVGDTTLAEAYTVNPAGVIVGPPGDPLPTRVSLTNSWLNGTHGVLFTGARAGDDAGCSVSGAGDVNGDGFDDFLVGAYRSSPPNYYLAGETYLVFGTSLGLPSPIELTNSFFNGTNGVILTGAAGARIGYSVSGAGDVNGDGFDDVLVGSPDANAAYLIYGRSAWASSNILSDAWLNGTNGVRFAGAKTGDSAGRSVSGAGDVNGDGFADLLIGAYGADPFGRLGAGETYLVFGRSDGFSSAVSLTNTWFDGTNGILFAGAKLSDYSGFAVSGAGDVNGDGFADFLIGAEMADPGGKNNAGEAYLVFGRTNGFPSAVTLTNTWLDGSNGTLFTGAAADDNSGWSVGGAGDVNGDGVADLLIGAIFADPSARSAAGETYLVFGRTNGFPSTAMLASNWLNGVNGVVFAGAAADDRSGYSIQGAGDVDGDGMADLLIGAIWAASSGPSEAGETYLVYGRTNALSSPVTLTGTWLDGTNGVLFAGAKASDHSGYSVSGAGDMNGDGFADLLIGAKDADPYGRNGAGEAYLVYGPGPQPAIVPSSGLWLGGYEMVLYGHNLGNGDITNVTVCGASVTSIDSQSATQVVVTIGRSLTGGLGDVRVYSTSFGETIRSNAFIYTVPVLRVTGLDGEALVSGEAANQAKGTYFPPMLSGDVVTNRFSITNNGTAELSIAGFVTNGPDAGLFSVSGIPATLGVSTSAQFTVTYSPVAFGGHTAALVITNTSQTEVFTINLAGATHRCSTNIGPYGGGNTLTITNGADFGAITNVLVGATQVSPLQSGSNWVTIILPSAADAGVVDIVIQTSDTGDYVLADAYTYNPRGEIGSPAVAAWRSLGDGLNAPVCALVQDDADLYASGQFTAAGGLSASRVAQWDGTAWTPLAAGLDGDVNALTHDGTNLYAAGSFSYSGSSYISRAAIWDGTAWTNLGAGLRDTVWALAHDGTALYAGGQFTSSGWPPDQVSVSRVARWTGTGWTNLGVGVNNRVYALAHDGVRLYAGGQFTTAGGRTANRVAMWDGTNWTNLGSGLNGIVRTLLHDGTNLYVGGDFTTAGGAAASRVAKWTGTVWTNLGSGLGAAVWALAHDGVHLYAGGAFTTAGGVTANRVAMWNGTTWTNRDSGMDGFGTPLVRALVCAGTNLYAGGDFTMASGVAASNAAQWVVAPATPGVEPSSGSYTGGFQVVIYGQHLGDGDITNVTVCGAAVTSIDSQSATQVVVTVAQAVEGGLGDVRVYSVSFGESVKSNAFTYTGPGLRIIGINGEALDNGAAADRAKGTYFPPMLSGEVLTNTFCLTNNGTAALSIAGYVTNGTDADLFGVSGIPATLGVSSSVLFAVTYRPASFGGHAATLLISNDSPSEVYTMNLAGATYQSTTNIGPYGGGNTITITNGADLGTITNVLVGSVGVLPSASGANWFTVFVPPGLTAGAVDIVVQTVSEGDITIPNAYTYNPQGEVLAVVPTNGLTSGGYQVAIVGTDLGDGDDITNVTLCGVSAASIESQSATQVVVWAGASGSSGLGDVRVFSISFGESVKSNAFTYYRTHATLTIRSMHGVGEPPVGVYTNLLGLVLTNRMSSPYTQGTTQYVCTGWTMSGNEPAGGSDTQVVMTVTNDAVLTWLWTTNYWLETTAGPHGMVEGGNDWVAFGVSTQIVATAEPYFSFTNWTGDTATPQANPLTVLMDGAKSVMAHFAAILTTNHPTPEWWLAEYGLTNDMDEVVNEDTDGDGVPNWAEYIMNTDPTNEASYLHMVEYGLAQANCHEVITTNDVPPHEVETQTVCDVVGQVMGWPCATDRVYDVQWGGGLVGGGWAGIDGLTNLTPSGSPLIVTNALDTNGPARFYRLNVRLP